MKPEEIKLSDGDLSWARDEICREQKCEDGLCAGLQFERARVVTAIDAAIAEAKHNAEQFPVAAPMVDVIVSRLEKLRTAILAGHQEVSQ